MKKILLLALVILALLCISQETQAVYVVEDNLFGTSGTYPNFGQYFATVLLPYIITIASIGAVLMIAIAGFKYITSGGSPDAVNESKGYIIGAIVGIAVIVFAMAFVNIFFGAKEVYIEKKDMPQNGQANTGGGDSSGGGGSSSTAGSAPEVQCPAKVTNYSLKAERIGDIEGGAAILVYLEDSSTDPTYSYSYYIENQANPKSGNKFSNPSNYRNFLSSPESIKHFDVIYQSPEKTTITSKTFRVTTGVGQSGNPYCEDSKKEVRIPPKS